MTNPATQPHRYRATLALDARATLGECIRWDEREKLIYWVDIPGRLMHRYDPATGHDEAVALPQEMGCFTLTERGDFVCGMRSGYARLDRFGGEFTPLASPDYDPSKARFNDGRCDSAGRFWAGTMWDPRDRAGGRVYRLLADGRFSAHCNPVVIANGITFSPDGRRMTLSDTPNHVLWAFDYDAATGTPSNRTVLRHYVPGGGRPDGACVDAAGNIFVALMAGGCVEKISPAGELLAVIELPIPNITCCTFAGDDLRTLYITTARVRMTDAELAAHPEAGGLFAWRLPDGDAPGIIEPRFAG
ncbi:MAG: SMP-30/gluconolactonase/LRE family protein [Burkholderiales bacterium]|nr:SMP-30/gluconolactonase/LRE family protein [Burkholderiales bacterium]